MESRLGQHKPDKALKQGVVAARRSGRGAKRAQGLVVAASLAATMGGWAIFSHEDVQPVGVSEQGARTAVVATVVQSAGETNAETSQGTSAAADPTIQATPTTGSITATTAATPQTAASILNSVPSGSVPQAITRTRSSR